jgi:hypothetical protein
MLAYRKAVVGACPTSGDSKVDHYRRAYLNGRNRLIHAIASAPKGIQQVLTLAQDDFHVKSKMAGTTYWGGRTFGFCATKRR